MSASTSDVETSNIFPSDEERNAPVDGVLSYKQSLPADFGAGTYYRKRLRDPLDPLYEQLDASVSLSLPQYESEEGQRLRRNELDKRRIDYPWAFDIFGARDTVPPYPASIPAEDFEGMWHAVEALSMGAKQIVGFSVGKAVESFASLFREQEGHEWDAIDKLYDYSRRPDVANRWREDVEFARQRLQGANPKMVCKCNPGPFPSHIVFSEEDVAPVFARDYAGAKKIPTMKSLIAEGKLFIVDYAPVMKNIRNPKERKLQYASGLFYLNDTKPIGEQFLPLAIQLQPWWDHTKPKPIVFTPTDRPNVWLVARIHFQTADCCYHGVVSHLLRTHLSMEAFWTACRRNLSSRHPLTEFLYPHFFWTLFIDWAGRRFLIADAPSNLLPRTLAMGFDGQNDMLHNYYSTMYSWEELAAPTFFAKNGTEVGGSLPIYPYRDDTMLYWPVISEYVKSVLKIIYPKDTDIANDTELRALADDLLKPEGCNFAAKGMRHTNGFWTRSDLEHILTTVLHVITSDHEAMNGPQYDYMGYVPNQPAAFFLDPPTSKTEDISMQDIVDGMPDYAGCLKQTLMMRGLGTVTNYAVGQYSATYFQGMPEMRPVIDKFRQNLREIGVEIERRNADKQRRPVPYTFLHPTRVGNSIQM